MRFELLVLLIHGLGALFFGSVVAVLLAFVQPSVLVEYFPDSRVFWRGAV
jgi:hypothetical protein